MSSTNRNTRMEIGIHLLVWFTLLVLPYSFTVGLGRAWSDLFYFWVELFLLAIIFYFNYFVLVNRWFFNNQKTLFFIGNAIFLFLFVVLKHAIFTNIQIDNKRELPPITARFYLDFLRFLIPLISAIAIQSGKRLVNVEMLQKEAENSKLQSELQHLKYQLQPHFFFNSLNNIYALVDNAPDKAKQTLHSLSKLMRHLLQSSEAEKVSLANEISFLNQYISLMTLRQNANTKVETHFPNEIPNIEIAPLLFVSIVENAFKHGVSASKPSWLYFEMAIDEHQITFISKNFIFPKNEDDMSGSGIGIENLKKRLALLYENNHSLNIETENGQFEVKLSLKIE